MILRYAQYLQPGDLVLPEALGAGIAAWSVSRVILRKRSAGSPSRSVVVELSRAADGTMTLELREGDLVQLK